MQTLLRCHVNFKSGYTVKAVHGILPITGLFETSVVLEEVQLAYSRWSKKLPIDSFCKYLSNRMSMQIGFQCCDCVQIGCAAKAKLLF